MFGKKKKDKDKPDKDSNEGLSQRGAVEEPSSPKREPDKKPAAVHQKAQNKTLQEFLNDLGAPKAEDFSNTYELVQVYNRTANKQQKPDLIKLSLELLRSFKEHPTQGKAILAAVVPLAGFAVDEANSNVREIVVSLFEELFKGLKDEKNIRKTWVFEGLADALELADPSFLTTDSLRTILDALIRQTEKLHETSDTTEVCALLVVLVRVFDAFISKTNMTQDSSKKEAKVVLPKEQFERIRTMLNQLEKTSSSISNLDLEFKYLLWFARQQLENRLGSDEPRYMFYARIAVKVVGVVRSLASLVASQGADFSAYVELFLTVKDICGMIKEDVGDKDPMWPILIFNVNTLLKNAPQSQATQELKNVILNACKGNSWMFKFAVIKCIQDMIQDGSLIKQQDFNLSKLYSELLLGIFATLDAQADEMKSKKQDRSKDQRHISDLMRMVTQTLVMMAQQGFPDMAEQARFALASIRSMLKNNNEQDQSLFERTLLQYADTNAIDRIESLYDSEKSVKTETDQTSEFFEQARRSSLPIEFIAAQVRKERLERFNDMKGRGAELALYVETLAGSIKEAPRIPENVASKFIREFISNELYKLSQGKANDERELMLVQGNAGSGKSLLLDLVEKELLDKYEWGGTITLQISLPSIKDPTKDIVQQALQKYSIPPEITLRIKKERTLILLLDGYDEIKSNKNLWITNELSEWSVVVILGCRTEYSESLGTKSMFYAGISESTGRYPKELFLLPFDSSQRNQYWDKLITFLNKYSDTFSQSGYDSSILSLSVTGRSWTSERFSKTVKDIQGLEALLETPFILSIVTIVLPTMRDIQAGMKLSRSDVYAAFLDFWFEKMAERLRRGKDKMVDAFDARSSFLEYGKDLSWQMFLKQQLSIASQIGIYIRETEESKYWARFFDRSRPETLLAMQGVPIRRDGTRISFLHKSIQEFMTALVLVDTIQSASDLPSLDSDSALNQKLITSEPSIVSFMVELLAGRTFLIDILRRTVYETRKRKDIDIASANSATLLNCMNVPFSYQDWSRVRIPNADLSDSVLNCANFDGADLSNVKLLRSQLDGVSFKYTNMTQVQFGVRPSLIHPSEVYSVCFSPDGKTIASGNWDKSICVWNAEAGVILRQLDGHTSWVNSVCFSPDGKTIVSGSDDKSVCIWNAETGALSHQLDGHTVAVLSTCFSPDGKTIVSGSGDKSIRVWNAETGSLLLQLDGHTDEVCSVCFSPDGKTIASGSVDESVRVWNAETGLLLLRLNGHTDEVLSVCFSPDGKTIVSGGKDKSVRIWNAETGLIRHQLDGHTETVNSVCFSPDGQTIVSGGDDTSILVWNADTGLPLLQLDGHTETVYSVCFSPDGQTIVSGSDDKFVRIWNAETVVILHQLDGHTDKVNSVCFSPDGQTIVSGGDDTSIRVWNAETGTLSRQLDGHTDGVLSVCFSADGKTIVSGSVDESVRVWNAETGSLLLQLDGHTDRVCSVCFSPDGKTIVSGGADKSVRVWNAETGVILRQLDEHTDEVCSVCFSPDGQTIVSGSKDQSILVWNAETGVILRQLDGHVDAVCSLCFSPDGKTIVSGSWDNSVRVWNAETGVILHQLDGHTDAVLSVCFSRDGKTIVSSSEDKCVCIWRVEAGVLLHQLDGHTDAVGSVCFSLDGKTIFSGSTDKSIRIWNAETGVPFRQLDGHIRNVTSVPLSKTVFGSYNGRVRIWNAETGSLLVKSDGHTDRVWSIRFSTAGQIIVSGSEDKSICIWNAETGLLVRQLDGHTAEVYSVCVSPDGKTIASGSGDKSVRVWNAETGLIVCRLNGHTKHVESVCFSPNGKTIASGSDDTSIRVWNAETGLLLLQLDGHTDEVWSVCFSPDGQKIVSGSWDKSIRVWNAETGLLLRQLDGHTSAVTSVCFSPDGQKIVSGSWDKSIRVWNAETGLLLRQLDGHTGWVNSTCFSPDGKTIVSGSGDKSVRVWNAETGLLLRQLDGHTGWVNSVCFSPDGKKIVSGSKDKSVRIWNAETGALSRQLDGHFDYKSLELSMDGQSVCAVDSNDKVVKAWNATTGDMLSELPTQIQITPVQNTGSISKISDEFTFFSAQKKFPRTIISAGRGLSARMADLSSTIISDANRLVLKQLGARSPFNVVAQTSLDATRPVEDKTELIQADLSTKIGAVESKIGAVESNMKAMESKIGAVESKIDMILKLLQK